MQDFTTIRQTIDSIRQTMRQSMEETILQAVDGVLKDIPNGEQYHDRFKEAIDGALINFQQQVQSQLGPAPMA